MIDRLRHELTEAEAEKVGCLAEADQRGEVGLRLEQLAKAGNISQIRSAEALASKQATKTRCQMADARRQRLQTELQSAEKGVFLRDGANDVPYSQQQRDRLILRRQELETQLLQESSRSSQLASEIAEERGRLDRLGHYDVTLPSDHVVWSVAASPGSAVTEGQTVSDLADCSRRFVVVDLPERDFESIKAGNVAAVRLVGSDEWMHGEVLQVRGSAARTDDRLLAAQIPTPNPGSITVEVALPQDRSRGDHNDFCNIGRLAEVRFQRSYLGLADYLNKSLHWVSSALSNLPSIL